MESPPTIRYNESPTNIAVAYVLVGASFKMQVLKQVLRSLELNVFEPETQTQRASQIRLAFDGCDSQACAAKAFYIRSLDPQSPVILRFPICGSPQIAPLFETYPKISELQGTVFDQQVEVYNGYWEKLHLLARFIEKLEISAQKVALSKSLIDTIAKFAQLREYISMPKEDAVLRPWVELLKRLGNLISGWLDLEQSGNDAVLQARLEAWTCLISPAQGQNRAGPLGNFRELLRGLGGAGRNFETAVARLESMKADTFIRWQNILTELQ